jgi:purine-binding chemotaxis protein CheW
MPKPLDRKTGKGGFDSRALLKQMREEYWGGLENAPEPEPADLTTLLTFRIGRERFALSVTSVREVTLVPPLLSKVPRSPEVLLGVMNLRGQIVPILDFHPLLGIAAPPLGKTARIVILRGAEGDLGILAEEVFGLDTIPGASLLPPLNMETALPASLVKSQARIRDSVAIVLDPQALMSSEILGPQHA